MSGATAPQRAHNALTKVPEITAFFWLVKILTTAMGETASDWGNASSFGPAIAVPAMALFLWLALKWQFKADRYYAQRYWLVVTAVATFGTSAADALHQVGVPYIATTALWGAITAYLFYRWNKSEGTLSIHSIFTRRRENFYWATVLASFALGTAAGDLTAISLNLGFVSSILIFGGLMLIPLVGWWKFNFNAIGSFWFAYVLTRPLGASISDWIAVPKSIGGLGVGPGRVTLALAVLIVLAVLYLMRSKIDVDPNSEAEDEALDHVPHAHHHDAPRPRPAFEPSFETGSD
jgi:uncharacterized membrane-anchored protein